MSSRPAAGTSPQVTRARSGAPLMRPFYSFFFPPDCTALEGSLLSLLGVEERLAEIESGKRRVCCTRRGIVPDFALREVTTVLRTCDTDTEGSSCVWGTMKRRRAAFKTVSGSSGGGEMKTPHMEDDIKLRAYAGCVSSCAFLD